MRRETTTLQELSIRNEITGIFSLFTAVFLFFSLISYSPFDPSFFHTSFVNDIHNYGGKIGAEIAAFFFALFGLASFFFIILLLLFTIHYFLNRTIQNLISKTVGIMFFILVFSSFLANIRPTFEITGNPINSGGLLGYLLNDFLTAEIKKGPALFLLLILLLISFMIITKLSLRRVMNALIVLTKQMGARMSAILTRIRETQTKKTRLRQLKKKYDDIEQVEIEISKEIKRDIPLRSEKKPPHKQPSHIPEESYLFSDLAPLSGSLPPYQPPPITYLDSPSERNKIDIGELEEKKRELSLRLQEFRINGEIVEYTPGPVITTFEFVPDIGVKVKDVSNLTEDLALVVKAQYVRIERILGKKAIGIEIPNKKREIIHLRELLESNSFRHASSPLTLAIGKTTSGEIFLSDLRDMPHLLIAGATGSGKSVVIHSIILSILYKSSAQMVKFVLIDPKRIEMVIYNSLPHLLTPVVVNPKLAKNALDWAVWEMENRYKKLAVLQVRNIEQYNRKLEMMDENEKDLLASLEEKTSLYYIVIIIDELADLMMVSAREVEEDIARLAQKSRAVGIHLILATQRPSIDVITGTIKNNFPSRIALAVPSRHDSRTIIDQMGAEKLLGNGDMLFLPPKTASLIRLHGAFVSEPETIRVVNHLAKQEKPEFNTQVIKQVNKEEEKAANGELDDLFFQAAECVITSGHAAASHLQRKLSVGYARAARLMDQLQVKGVVSPPNSKNQREILLTITELKEMESVREEESD